MAAEALGQEGLLMGSYKTLGITLVNITGDKPGAADLHDFYGQHIERARELARQIGRKELLRGMDPSLRAELMTALQVCAHGADLLIRREKGKASTRQEKDRERWAGWLDLYRQYEAQHPDWNFTRLCKTVATKAGAKPETVEKRIRAMLRNSGD
jgi:phosphoglycolate phosphatase-like HAD superfamily hydrolase